MNDLFIRKVKLAIQLIILQIIFIMVGLFINGGFGSGKNKNEIVEETLEQVMIREQEEGTFDEDIISSGEIPISGESYVSGEGIIGEVIVSGESFVPSEVKASGEFIDSRDVSFSGEENLPLSGE